MIHRTGFGLRTVVVFLFMGAIFYPHQAQTAQKPRIAVVEFKAKIRKAHRELGTAMSDILVDELIQTGKYTVLERSVIDKIRQEQNLVFSGEVDAATGAKFGKMIGAQYLVVGSVTKFEEKKKGGAIGGLISKKVAGGAAYYQSEVGITIRIINSTTGEIVTSEKINKKESSIGLAALTHVFGRPVAGGLFKSASMQTAVEKAIKDAVKVIGTQIPTEGLDTDDKYSEIEIVASGINFQMLKSFTNMLEKVEGVDGLKKSFSKRVAEIQVRYKGSAEKLADVIFNDKSDDMNFEITGLSEKKIELSVVK